MGHAPSKRLKSLHRHRELFKLALRCDDRLADDDVVTSTEIMHELHLLKRHRRERLGSKLGEAVTGGPSSGDTGPSPT